MTPVIAALVLLVRLLNIDPITDNANCHRF